ncbi:MAG: DEAD/DEAH box helicase [Treponema sp.]|jgi:DEAD/DEAH box helicase domain-containing protein|nr:DEAD/DEAH box helicase [Treponema sp.]
MEKTTVLDRIIEENNFAPCIAEDRRIPASEGSFVPFPAELDSRIADAVRRRGIERLYTHQAEVWDAAQSGNVVVVTPTASGKTLCYNLPVLQTLLADDKARALYLFPTKALSQDQQSELNELVEGNPPKIQPLPVKVSTYDGDTPGSLRVVARDLGRIIISNPDMLHDGILPNHPKWIKFFSHLAYVVIDEAHSYRGVFGSHVANVIRRLRRVALFYGSKPRFILCSATIANPQELAESLVGEEVALVDGNGAPRGEKRIILYNPPLVDAVQGVRRPVTTESQRWMLAFLRANIKTILFAHSRVRTEVTASYVNDELKNIFTDNGRIKVEAYRGGLLPNERREIEKGLRNGGIQGVVSTNALELGIDIGGLDAAVMAGFPGSFNSFWQQTGRAGRRGGASAAVFIASASPLDQFIMDDPDWFFRKSVEEARISPDNPYIYMDHVKCAAFELPFRDAMIERASESRAASGAGDFFGKDTADALSFLEQDGVVRHTAGKWHWADRSFPAEGVSLRSAMTENVVIIDITDGRNAVIGEMDRPSAKELIFRNAVYIHRGRQYLVEDLNIEEKKCLVREAEVNYYTDGYVKTDIKVLAEDERLEYGGARGCLGDVLVRTQAAKFKKIRFHTQENIGYGNIDLPEEEMQTRALALLFPPESSGGKSLALLDESEAGSVLSGVGKLIKQIAPMFLLCDSRDIGVAERVRDPHFDIPALYVYDKYPGGTGLAEALSRRGAELFAAIYEVVVRCSCAKGCPSCVGAGENKAGTAAFLRASASVAATS